MKKIAIFSAVVVLIFAGCLSSWQGEGGTFNVSIGINDGNSRAAVPWSDDHNIEDLIHTITLSGGPGPDQKREITGTGTVQFTVTPGLWDITVEAKDKDKTLIAVGSRTGVEIKPGPNGSVIIIMEDIPLVPVPGSNLAEKLAWLKINAASNTNYKIEVNANENINPVNLSYDERTKIGITLVGTETERIIKLLNTGSVFTVDTGVTLTLDNNITLQGLGENNAFLVQVTTGGALLMKTGSRITGNTTADLYGSTVAGGVAVWGGTFTMNGGEISGNIASSGGGVYMSGGGTFTMNGGKISGNEATIERGNGGAVYVTNGTFTMNDGKISGNKTNGSGGGVAIETGGTFTMNDGEISDNSAGGGGGVSLSSINATFIMNGGEISDNSAVNGGGVFVENGTFTMNCSSEISGNTAADYGGGVYVGNGTFEMRDESIISGNKIINENDGGYGGGVCVKDYGTFTMYNGSIYGNNAGLGEGGGVYVYVDVDDGFFRIISGSINIDNTASTGAALFVRNAGTAQRGNFEGPGGAWNKLGDLDTMNELIYYINGRLIP